MQPQRQQLEDLEFAVSQWLDHGLDIGARGEGMSEASQLYIYLY
jgi:hypothetical protein